MTPPPPLFLGLSLNTCNREEKLDGLKTIAKEYLERPEIKARTEELRRLLSGEAVLGRPSVFGGEGGETSDSAKQPDQLSSLEPAPSGEEIESPQ